MNRILRMTALLASLSLLANCESALAVHGGRVPRRATDRAQYYPWHGGYVHTEYGAPVALVVPPTARLQTNWSWGTGSSRIQRIDHQFGRNWPGPYGGGQGFLWTPPWPSDTTQFGVYPVRAPW